MRLFRGDGVFKEFQTVPIELNDAGVLSCPDFPNDAGTDGVLALSLSRPL